MNASIKAWSIDAIGAVAGLRGQQREQVSPK